MARHSPKRRASRLRDTNKAPKPPSSSRRRPSIKAFALGAAALLGSAAALANAGVNMLHTRAPDLALMIDPTDPVALVRRAELAVAAGDERAAGDAAMLSALQRSVRGMAINGPAFRLYGLNRAANADLEAVRAQMVVSDRMERRDVGAQLWLIEDAVERNDVEGALRHYDTALRITEASRGLLYPVLTEALGSAFIRERFQPYLQANPPWLESFLRFAVSKTSDPVALAQLAALNGGWPQGEAFSSLDTELLARLFSNENYAEAAAHFRTIEGTDQSLLTSLRLTSASTDWRLAPIAWQPFQIDGIESYILASSTGEGAVEIEAEIETGFKGPVARKFLSLKPGRYQLTARMRARDFSGGDTMRWTLSCPGAGAATQEMQHEAALTEEMAIDAEVLVPEGCPVQSLVISAQTLVTTRYLRLVLASAQLQTMGPASSDEKQN